MGELAFVATPSVISQPCASSPARSRSTLPTATLWRQEQIANSTNNVLCRVPTEGGCSAECTFGILRLVGKVNVTVGQ